MQLSRALLCPAVLVAVACTSACPGPPVLAPRDGGALSDAPPFAPRGAPLRVVAVVARDASGRAWPLDGAPRRPVLEVITSAPLAQGEPAPLLLVRGEPDEALSLDAARAPFTSETRARAVPARLSNLGERAVFELEAALSPGEIVTVVVAGWAVGEDGQRLEAAHLARVVVSVSPDAGAALVSAFPADGTQEVPTDLARVVLVADGSLELGEGSLRVSGPAGVALVGRLGLARCGPLGMDGIACLTWSPAAALPPRSELLIESTEALRDATGAVVPPARIVLRTAIGRDAAPPRVEPPDACAIDERETPLGCVLATDEGWRLEVSLDEPARLELTLPGRVVRALAPAGRARLPVDGLSPASRLEGALVTTDLADRRGESAVVVETEPSLAPVVLSEICADPEGPEPAQEWIELANLGEDEVPLAGLSISDRPDAIGTTLASARSLPPGGRALIVPDDFDAARALVPAGALLVHVGRAVVSSGLANAGEPLYLRDAAGRRLSHVPALPAPGGRCVARDLSRALRADEADVFHYDACSPGR
jgi:fermentation-respiration switch protein FrsA (DUF1100 family)